jgi:hypothetical protein
MNYVDSVALRAGCKLIPVPEDLDTGIDGFIEFAQEQTALGKLVAFQVKRGESFFRHGRPHAQTDKKHLLYWQSYCMPVLFILVNEDGTESYWMDVQQHIRDTPEIVESGPYVLYPPKTQPFSVSTLIEVILPRYARQLMFGDVISALCSSSKEERLASLSLAYPFHAERRTVFAITSGLCFETEHASVRILCDFLSRYLPHPETSFGAPSSTSEYAEQLLGRLGDTQLLRILEAFETEEQNFDATVEIFNMEPEEVWVRQDMFERASVQQSMAVVIRAIADERRLLSIVTDNTVDSKARRAAVALFGYLGYTCEVELIIEAMRDEKDDILVALLTWLQFWIEYEETEEAQ